MDLILAFLLTVHCAPDVIITPSNATFYLAGVDNIRVVYLRPDQNKPHILVHELYHDCQWQRAGGKPAQTWTEWHAREREAKRIELQFIEWYGLHIVHPNKGRK